MAKRKKIKLNVSKSIRMDPTRTFTIRKAMAGQFRKRWNAVKGIVNKTIIENDGLGVKTQKPKLTFNQVASLPNIKSLTNAQKMRLFSDWFGIMAADQLENPRGWFDKFIAQAYEKGLAQSFQEAKRTGILPEQFASMKTDDFIFQATRTQIHRDAVSLAFERTSKAVKGVYNAVTDEGARIISDGLANGDNPRVIASKLNKRIDKIGITRARAIAQTETIRAHADATLNNYESFGEDEIVVLAEWSSAGDSITCERCLSLDGSIYTIKEARGLIPRHVNCLPGDALVSPVGRVTGVSKRWYNGDMVVINTARGNVFTSTPNHPICTDKGFVPVCDVNEGHKVFNYIDGKIPPLMNGNAVHSPSRIEDIAESFLDNSKVMSMPVPLSSKDFHGDSSNGDIAVVGANGFLRGAFNVIGGFNHIQKLYFILRYLIASILICFCSFALLFKSVFPSLGCLMRIFNLISSLVFSHSVPFNFLGLTLSSNSNSVIGKSSPYSTSTNHKFFSDRVFRFSAFIKRYNFINREIDSWLVSSIIKSNSFTADYVTHKKTFQYSGYVYNIETESSYYISNGLSTHNCRCSFIPNVPSEEKKTKAMAKATRKKVRESIARDGGSKRSAWAGTEKQSIAGKSPIASKKPRQSTLDKELNAIRKDRGDEPLPAGSASKG